MTKCAEPNAIVDTVCGTYGDQPSALLEILHDVQQALGYVPIDVIAAIAQRLNISKAEVHGVVSFYHDFSDKPRPSVVVKLCRAEACQAMGGDGLAAEAAAKLADDNQTLVLPVYCLGNCALAPAALVNDRLLGRLTVKRLLDAVQDAGK
jgi:formate dehydrogenase subunit gamma